MRLPPLSGAVQLTVADPLPAVAATLLGALGAVGGVAEAGLSSRVVMRPRRLGTGADRGRRRGAVADQLVLAEDLDSRSTGETLDRSVHPVPAVRVSLKPESA